jgi:type II secretory pathway component PulC
MKNKQFTYLLMVFVAALWAIIFYRIYLATGNEQEFMLHIPQKKMKYFTMLNHQTDKAMLNFNYRDPFSPSNSFIIEIATKTNHIVPAIKPMPKPPINWLGILYTGYINNPSSKQKLVIIMANGKEFMLAQGQSLNGIKLLKYAGDSVKIQYQNKAKYIKLK